MRASRAPERRSRDSSPHFGFLAVFYQYSHRFFVKEAIPLAIDRQMHGGAGEPS